MTYQTLFVASLPRSGSTVLTHMLDQREDVLALPESFFPATLELVDDATFSQRELMAGLFIASCSDGAPLDFNETLECITPDRKETLDRLATAIARHMERDPAKIRVVIWKATRIVGCWKFAESMGGRFLILDRPLLNIYNSQFRVHFGQKNRNPLRFSLFAASYEWAFRHYPANKTRRLAYANIPSEIEAIAKWAGSEGKMRAEGESAVSRTAGNNAWHSGIGSQFQNRDREKLAEVKKFDAMAIRVFTTVIQLIPLFARFSRTIADRRQFRKLIAHARDISSSNSNTIHIVS